MTEVQKSQRFPWGILIASLIAFVILLGLGTWQVERLQWKEALLASTQERVHEPPLPLAEMEKIYREEGTVEYRPVTVSGTFMHQGERHFLSTYDGKPGFNVYTPLMLEDGRFVLVNRGFVPYEKKDAETRLDGQLDGPVTVTGLARDPLSAKPGYFVPDNDIAKNIFYWKDWSAMAESADIPSLDDAVPFFIDADNKPNFGGLPVGGVTIIDFPNNHLQYAVTWYGLALALLGVVGTWFWRYRKMDKG
ncbi:SURF1 family protein [Brucella pituitosa]|uniref:SURF1-like protein n=1 Tax=Brucella pituitosa TaxID=571256 RepID=A0ABS3JXG5_9HYPH|nr:SURF1 family protein [Brucella pituitosa]PRA57297.1 surfeit locus 1 family protein [Ochrobactrum sp. MYb68]PRA89286.1 surfeit locus 1 family protein [Ochrobactrum sp. MYb29]MBO1038837.1 SURF1 family protein [Brucella pituitosa]MCK4204494.1 SURF1 family protein [Brucella pituitosa]PJO47430.1 SURF1 family protein [Brucella pituitosa]